MCLLPPTSLRQHERNRCEDERFFHVSILIYFFSWTHLVTKRFAKEDMLSESQLKFTEQVQRAVQDDAALENATFNYNHDYELDVLPPAVKALRGVVEILHIDNCFRLQELHPGVGDLSRLRWLNVSYNKLQSLPSEVSRLTRLERLYAANNEIEFLPLEYWALKNLEELRLDNNRLRALPTYVLFLPKLRELLIENNPLLTSTEVDGAEPAVLFPPQRTGDCASCSIRFANSSMCFLSFHDVCGHKAVPIVHYVCSERCKEQLDERLHMYDAECKKKEEVYNSPLRARD
jgi:hypothetical protein